MPYGQLIEVTLFHSSHPRNKNKAYAFFKAGFIESWGRGYLKIQDEPEADYTTRYLHWTEDNRMHAAVDDRYYSYYAYDYSGERRLKHRRRPVSSHMPIKKCVNLHP